MMLIASQQQNEQCQRQQELDEEHQERFERYEEQREERRMQFQLQQASMQQQQQFMFGMLMMMHIGSSHPGMSVAHCEIDHHGVPLILQTMVEVPHIPQNSIGGYTLHDDPEPEDEGKMNEGEGKLEE